MSLFAVFVILTVFGVIISQPLAAARGAKALPWNRPPIPWRYSEMQKQVAGGPLPAWLVYGLCVVALVNFAVYVIAAQNLGGDAVNGHQAAGRYYLSMNGRLTETTAAVYRYSIWHTLSLFVTHPLAGLALWWGTRTYRAARA